MVATFTPPTTTTTTTTTHPHLHAGHGFVCVRADRAAVLGGGRVVCRRPVLVLHTKSERRVVEAGGSAAVVAGAADAAAQFLSATRARLCGAIRQADGHRPPSPANTSLTRSAT